MSHLGIQKIISGGQSGVDQGVLYAGEKLGIETGGWIPLKGMTIDGEKLKLLSEFGCKEISYREESLAKQYVRRSKLNVDSSDGSIAIRLKESVGTDFTLGYCLTGRWQSYKSTKKEIKNQYKPVLIVDDLKAIERYRKEIHDFILDNKIMVLNVFGHRDTYLKTNTIDFLIKVLSE